MKKFENVVLVEMKDGWTTKIISHLSIFCLNTCNLEQEQIHL